MPTMYETKLNIYNNQFPKSAIFIILILVHGTEAVFLRMDETIFGENFINKVANIFI